MIENLTLKNSVQTTFINNQSVYFYRFEMRNYEEGGKCQPQDYDAQIASITLCKMQYNILSVIKRFHEYETN